MFKKEPEKTKKVEKDETPEMYQVLVSECTDAVDFAGRPVKQFTKDKVCPCR